MNKKLLLKSLVILLIVFTGCAKNRTPEISIIIGDKIGTPAMHGVDKITAVLMQKKYTTKRQPRWMRRKEIRSFIFTRETAIRRLHSC